MATASAPTGASSQSQSGPVQGEHQLPAGPVSQRMRGQQWFEHADRFVGPAQRLRCLPEPLPGLVGKLGEPGAVQLAVGHVEEVAGWPGDDPDVHNAAGQPSSR